MKDAFGRWGVAIAAGLGMLLAAPSIVGGRAVDDIHLESTAARVPPWAILDKPRQTREQLERLREVQWWVDLGGHSPAHLRPVGSLSHAADFAFAPGRPAIWHLHSVLLYGLAIAVVGLVYRGVLGPGHVAGLAAVAFAVDDGHGFSVGHVASRPTLVALILGGLGLLAHDRAARGGFWPGVVLGPVLVGVAMLSYELAAGFFGFVAAHLVCLDDRPVRTRALAAAPWVIVGLAWAVLFEMTGSGSHGSGMYTDPVSEPLLYAQRAIGAAPVYAASLLLGVPSDFWVFLPSGLRAGLWVVLAVASAAVAVGLRPRDRVGAFFAVGAAIATIPAFAAWPNDRLLPIASIGVAGLVARHLAEPGASRWLAALLVLVHLVIAPLLLPLRANFLALTYGRVHAVAIPSIPRDPALREQTLVIANSPDFLVGMSAFLAMADGGGRAGGYRMLAITPGEVTWERPDETTLVARVPDGLLRDPFSTLNRGDQAPLAAGQRIELRGLVVEVVATDAEHHPTVVRFTFDRPLDDPSLRWIGWSGDRYTPWVPPAAGTSRTEAPIAYRELLLGF